ncbi:MAG: NTP transferase domain-containing protein [Proteobacteria bacterium]|jgi:choline kinase|nr:NTP transferase domain-containing protein [Pseudomonadota bacterium]
MSASSPIADVVVVLAAGMGTRLKSDQGPPKPLVPLGGRPLVLRVLDRFAEAGVREAIVVLGHRADEVRGGIEGGAPAIPVTFALNPRYRMSNGLSVLAASEAVGARPFFLSMSDHVFEPSLIRGLGSAALPEDGLVLAVDRKLDRIFDEDDATKVRTEGGCIVEIHKELAAFDAVDTGLFACTPALFSAIREAAARRPDGDCSLSDGVKALAAGGRALVHDIGDGWWQDVDTPEAMAHAALRMAEMEGRR